MKQFLVIGALVLMNVSCSDSNSKQESSNEIEHPQKENTESVAVIEKNGLPESKKDSEDLENGFYEFWDRFRTAVKEQKVEDIVNMANFPFETRGEMDSDPIIKFSKKEFIKLLPELLNQYAGVDLEGTSEAGLVLKTTKIDQEEIDRKSVRVGSLVFEKMKTGWKFTFAYVNSPTYEAIGINNER